VPSASSLAKGMVMDVSEVLSMVYYCELGTGAPGSVTSSGSGLTDCEWLIPGSYSEAAEGDPQG
jgi:hypothetical protein